METMSRRNLVILARIMIVIMLGFGMMMPIMPFLVDSLGATGNGLLFESTKLDQL